MGEYLVALRQGVLRQEIYDFLRQNLAAYRAQVERFELNRNPFYEIHLNFLPPPVAHHRRPRGGGHPKI